ncbi:tyrosine-type recombinase/integrase [Rummeliibacillus pycnus]|uniref:site-specific integrase n=1 Tax=Rummeliibacillus pycnus TaxID=101070 RepID=UPI0037C816DC
MYFKQLDKTTWLCIGEVSKHPVTGKRKQISRRGKTKKEAEYRVKEAIKEIEKNYLFDPKIKFAEFVESWFELYKRRGVKQSTLDNRRYCINVLNTHMRKTEVKKITSVFYQNVLNELQDGATSHTSLKGIHSVAQMIFKYAVEVGIIEKSPTDATFVPRPRKKIADMDGSETEKLYLNANELKLFLEALDNYNSPVIKTLIYLITFTGMRPGEAISLYPVDINFEEMTVNINKTTYRKDGKKGEFELTTPKTANSVRVVDVDKFIIDKIRDMQDFQFVRNYIESEYLFRMPDGYPPTVDYLRSVTRRLGEKMGIKKQLHTYMLRHTHVSLLAEAGVDLPYIMNRVGHKNSKTTTEIYLHVTNGMRENARSKMHMKFSNLIKR